MRKRVQRTAVWLFIICLLAVSLTACGDDIREETSQEVEEKTNQALQLYSDLEKLVSDHNLQTDASFTDMKKKLTDMSVAVKTSIQDATETDGQQTLKELDEIIRNLENVKKKVEDSVSEVQK